MVSKLRQVLEAFKDTPHPLSLRQLSLQLNIDQALLEDMIGYWVRKGKLRDINAETGCNSSSCGGCTIVDERCPFIVEIPKRYALVTDTEPTKPAPISPVIDLRDIG